jgi:hypothetical protein
MSGSDSRKKTRLNMHNKQTIYIISLKKIIPNQKDLCGAIQIVVTFFHNMPFKLMGLKPTRFTLARQVKLKMGILIFQTK